MGDGDGKTFRKGGFSSLTVVASELTHIIVEKSPKLVYEGESGSLNSHLSAIFAVLTEQWNKKQSVDQASWLLGAEIWNPKIKGAALRSVKAPGTAYDDPAIGKDNQ